MAQSDALWNEVARLANTEFFEYGEMLTGKTLKELIKVVSQELTDESPSV